MGDLIKFLKSILKWVISIVLILILLIWRVKYGYIKIYWISKRDRKRVQRENGLNYDDIQVKQAIVHTREDVCGLYDQLCNTKREIGYIKNYCFISMVAIIIFVVKDLFF